MCCNWAICTQQQTGHRNMWSRVCFFPVSCVFAASLPTVTRASLFFFASLFVPTRMGGAPAASGRFADDASLMDAAYMCLQHAGADTSQRTCSSASSRTRTGSRRERPKRVTRREASRRIRKSLRKSSGQATLGFVPRGVWSFYRREMLFPSDHILVGYRDASSGQCTASSLFFATGSSFDSGIVLVTLVR